MTKLVYEEVKYHINKNIKKKFTILYYIDITLFYQHLKYLFLPSILYGDRSKISPIQKISRITQTLFIIRLISELFSDI